MVFKKVSFRDVLTFGRSDLVSNLDLCHNLSSTRTACGGTSDRRHAW